MSKGQPYRRGRGTLDLSGLDFSGYKVRRCKTAFLGGDLSLLYTEPWRCDLIATHLEAARATARRYERRYPGVDCEPAIMHSLYLAALHCRPGPGFAAFMQQIIYRQIGSLIQRHRRKPAPLAVDPEILDQWEAR